MRRRVSLVLSAVLFLSIGLALPGAGAGAALHARVTAPPTLPPLPLGDPTPVATETVTTTAPVAVPSPSPSTIAVPASIPLTRVSADPLTASTPGASSTLGQHATEVEPAVYSLGGVTVATFQVGRLYDGGSMATGWATSLDAGRSWRHGLLPGLTKTQTPPGPFDRLSDPSVAYDAAHHVWLISSLAVTDQRGRVARGTVVVNRSGDGLTWTSPYTVAAASPTVGGFYDKDWITCDSSPTSPYDGHCYAQWDSSGKHDLLLMSTSLDGGKTWSPPAAPAGRPYGLGGQPVVRPDGTVVVPALGERGAIIAYSSLDGGKTWGPAVTVGPQRDHAVAGRLRTEPLPSATVDGGGTVYVAWQDCRFEARCADNDIVFSSSSDGAAWSPTARVPIDAVGSGADHFIPGLGVDRATRGAHAQLALAYYYYPAALCLPATCQLYAGFISSDDGGATWSAPRRLAGPISLGLLPRTSLGSMVGDYIATAFSGGDAISVLAVAKASPIPGGPLDEAIYAARIAPDRR